MNILTKSLYEVLKLMCSEHLSFYTFLFESLKGGEVMFKFFSFKKKQTEKENNTDSLIVTRLDRIIELLEQQQKESAVKNIHFDHVQIDYLENIVFRLDNIDIDELSGKLVIGNNIMSSEDLAKSLVQKVDKENAKKEAMSESSPFPSKTNEKNSNRFSLPQ